MSLIPVFSQYRITPNDSLLIDPRFNLENDSEEFWTFVMDYSYSIGLPIGLKLSHKKKKHHLGIGLIPSITLPRSRHGGITILKPLEPGDSNKEIYATFVQIHDFRPNGLIAIRSQVEYQYLFRMVSQSFFIKARIDYQLSNLPVVNFNVYNSSDELIVNFDKTFPRFYGLIGLGWQFGNDKL